MNSFTPLQTYKVLKHPRSRLFALVSFTPLQTYKVLKLAILFTDVFCCFTPLQTYKVLKPPHTGHRKYVCFTPLQTYKVLKRDFIGFMLGGVLHHYKLTRFSNRRYVNCRAVEFYTITNLQGSQTDKSDLRLTRLFYTITNLQGSQTNNRGFSGSDCFTPLQTYKVLKPQMRSSPNRTYRSICVSHLVMYKTHVFIY